MSSRCYSYYYGYYDCNGGLSYGARIGVGVGVAVGVVLLIALCSYWRRRNLRNQFAKYRPPALPFTNNNNTNTNPYANNPPPPPPGSWNPNNNSTFAGNPYGNNPAPPQAAYQPSMAGQYGARTGGDTTASHEHGYEWEQAREAERLEREGEAAPPPGYHVAAQSTGNTDYAPPPGAPPNKRTTSGVV